MDILILFVPLLLISSVDISCSLDAKDVVFVIISQNNPYYIKKAEDLKENLITETENSSAVYLTHQDFHHHGDWAVFPILTTIWNNHGGHCSWIFVCTQDTKINVPNLLRILNDSKNNFIGRGLKDKEPTIIHHFASVSTFKYPLLLSGFAISNDLLKSLVEKIESSNSLGIIDFSIDASYEFALFVKEQLKESLTDTSDFCINYSDNCATYVSSSYKCENSVDDKKILFAVKTYHKFHLDRVPVIKETWGKKARNLIFYSDKLDKEIPTVRLNVPNTNYGHCGKTRAIIDDLHEKFKNNKKLRWAVISDDDTILSVRRVQELASCFNYKLPYVIGERYGYMVNSPSGYNYITGGGGVVLSRAAILKYRSMKGKCECPTGNTPDDMYLFGVCLSRLNVTLVHVPLFHQARPTDYSDDYLSVGEPISFHKHWMIDPIQVYNEWFHDIDDLHVENTREEL